MSQQSINLITKGILVSNLHYGVFVRNWWIQKTIKNSKNYILPILYHLYMRVTCELNNKLFTLSVVQSITNPLQPGFICTCKEKSTEIMTSAFAVINTLYQEIFERKTKYSGPTIMGFYNNNIVEKLVEDVIFFPIFINVESFLIVITSIGYSDNSEFNGTGNEFSSSIITKFWKKKSIILQQIKNNVCILDIYQELKKIIQYQDETSNNVWKKSGINKKFDGNDLFRITHSIIQSILQRPPNNRRICTPNEWNNFDILQQTFDRHIKFRKITITILLDWKKLFDNWLLQKSTIIQIPKWLQKIYPDNYQICEKELYPSGDKETLLNFYNLTLVQLKNKNKEFSEIKNSNNLFWKNFRVALKNNKRGIDGKIRILSIIADKFCYKDLREKLQVGSTSINSAFKHARLNSPGILIYLYKPNKGRDSETCDIGTVKKPRDIQNVQYWIQVVALKNNKRGIDGKIRILSIIADKFCYKDLREKLQVGSTSINSAFKHARLNSPGSIVMGHLETFWNKNNFLNYKKIPLKT
ncbi:hypothetical protein Glove_166g30 [Diversispora epigaea]|uniref:Uncharacterized protein n=1 Tax=Diversispora epigaea TaxID=1348612 RepID=A0A397IQH2_9GLOM|nr:hypothetical protein Glove_166g30 [Diversispora epigaea]